MDLIQEVADRAQGIYLWVYLVRSLRRGLIDDNEISLLQGRLDILPIQLEEYFREISRKIKDV